MKRKLMSLLLVVLMIITTMTTATINANASMMPLKEVKAYLVLNGYSDEQIKAMPIKDVLSKMQDKDGNYITVPESAEVVWAHFKDNDGNVIHDEYHVIDRNTPVDMSEFEYTTGYTMELIVGSGKQLDPNNTRYLVRVYLTNKVSEKVSFDLYTQSTDGTREQVKPDNVESAVNTQGGITKYTNVWMVKNHQPNTEYYLGMTSVASEHPNVNVDVYTLEEFRNFRINGSGKNINDQILNPNMKEKDAGYKGIYDAPTTVTDFKNMFFCVYTEKSTGKVMGMDEYVFAIVDDDSYITGEMNSYENGSLVDSTCLTANDITIDDLKIDFGNGTASASSAVTGMYYMLKEGYSADQDYYFALNAHSSTWTDNANGHVVKAVVGHYDSLSAAESQKDIKDQLIPVNRDSAPYGYKANYNYKNEGQKFTVFFDDNHVFKFDVRVKEYDPQYDDNKTMRNFDSAPIVGSQDYWFRVNGVKQDSKTLDSYVVENGKNINMDTMYGYGYQTVFVNDKNADLSKLKPTFWFGDAKRVETYIGKKQESGESVQDFSKGSQQYTTLIDDKAKNYNVQIVKKQTGPKLFVNGPSERSVFLDEYFEYKHDILIANIGDQKLTGLKVKLDAKNVKLDDYWTVGGENNDTLAPFTTTTSNSKYGELANITKIRLLPDGDGEVEGTLTISADGQKDVVIKLNGRASNPKIITNKLDDAVKYVPYSYVVSTDNMNDWNSVNFSIESGKLPEGLTLYPTTGEIYGVPQETGTFKIRVKATYGRSDYFEPSYADLTLTVKDNTNENVYLESDDGYKIKKAIGTQVGQYDFELDEIEDTVFTSHGEYDNFVGLWLNGKKLVEGVDYTKEKGSTKITIKSQTLEDKATENENTISAEYRENKGNRDSKLKKTSQNFRVKGKTASQKVIDKINALPKNITLDDKAKVQAARNAYNALSSKDKNKVTNYSKLQKAEQRIKELEQEAKDKAAAFKVAQAINDLPTTITLKDKQAVQQARKEYNQLTNKQKSYVPNLKRLEEAESAIATLEKKYEQVLKDKAAAEVVVKAIDLLPEKVSLNDKDSVNKAREGYNNLTGAQKEFVSNYNKLLDAEMQIVQLEKDNDEIKTVTFVGVLVDKNGKPMKDKKVEIHSTKQNALTDPNGSFLFNNVEFGKHTLYVKDNAGNIESQKEFNIIMGTPLSIKEDTIVAENHSVFTVKIEVKDGKLSFVDINKGNLAPKLESNEEDDLNKGITISSKVDLKADSILNKKGVSTGDNSNISLSCMLMTVSVLCLGLLKYLKRRALR